MSRSIRSLALFVAAALFALPFTHGVAALARLSAPGPPAALATSIACLVVCATVVVRRGDRGLLIGGLSGALVGAFVAFGLDALGAGLGLLIAGPVIGYVSSRIDARLPHDLADRASRRPFISAAWIVLGVLSVAQTARIAAFMSDDTLAHGPTIEGFWEHHMCLPAYLQAAELNRDGASNVYDAAHYPGVTRDAQPETQVVGMQHYLEDPYQYPPQFLLLPRALLASGLDYATLRTLWFAGQALLFFATAIALARFVGGERGFSVLAWMPLVWVAPVTMFNFQFGQAHLAALCVAVLGMLAIARRRNALGGALLACAVLAKLFPAVLLIPLAVQRKWKALGATVVACALITALSLPILGTAPYISFFEYHLPRLFSGEAFAFQEAWPEVATDLIASNQSVKGLVDKLALLGFPAALDLKTMLSAAYLIACAAIAYFGSKRATTPHARAVLWLGLLTLGALSSPGAWSDYVLISAVWMLAFVSAPLPAERGMRAALAACWVLTIMQPGVLPLIPVDGERTRLILAAIGHSSVLILCAASLIGRRSYAAALAERSAVIPAGG